MRLHSSPTKSYSQALTVYPMFAGKTRRQEPCAMGDQFVISMRLPEQKPTSAGSKFQQMARSANRIGMSLLDRWASSYN